MSVNHAKDPLESSPVESEQDIIKQQQQLRDHYAQFNISVDALDASHHAIHRFVRIHPAFPIDETILMLKNELPAGSEYPILIPWLDPTLKFYALPGDFRLVQSPCYQSGRIYGQDVSSGAAVAALLSNYHDQNKEVSRNNDASPSSSASPPTLTLRVLDLCCAPGLKLCAMADYLRYQQCKSATLVGVDCSPARLATCRNILQKQQIEPYFDGPLESHNIRIRLYCNDGTNFGLAEPTNLIFDSLVATEQCDHLGKRKYRNKSSKGRERKRLRELCDVDKICGEPVHPLPSLRQNIALFDRVLVDAECSTDGSIKHLIKRMGKQHGTGAVLQNPRLTEIGKQTELVELQRRLAARGFALLRQGGFMVYSTCSLCMEQNEGVVEWLLAQYPIEARLIPLSFDSHEKKEESSSSSNQKHFRCHAVGEGRLKGTIRFLPSTSSIELSASKQPETKCNNNRIYGDGFFLAKIARL